MKLQHDSQFASAYTYARAYPQQKRRSRGYVSRLVDSVRDISLQAVRAENQGLFQGPLVGRHTRSIQTQQPLISEVAWRALVAPWTQRNLLAAKTVMAPICWARPSHKYHLDKSDTGSDVMKAQQPLNCVCSTRPPTISETRKPLGWASGTKQ